VAFDDRRQWTTRNSADARASGTAAFSRDHHLHV
jgi:hypothetical protein